MSHSKFSSLTAQARGRFHAGLIERGLLTIGDGGVPSISDRGSAASVAIGRSLLSRVGAEVDGVRLAGQSSGRGFEDFVRAFLAEMFPLLSAIRCGNFIVAAGGDIARFEQYAHLTAVEHALRDDRQLRAALGRDYIIHPDVVIFRKPICDEDLNALTALVDDTVALFTPIRMGNGGLPILHASISCKWTIRSDRAQNARSEALNLIRNRKGRLPHIAVVTAEPLISRIASLALGTGDIDCVYHIALPELCEAVEESASSDAEGLLRTMTEGRRLRDIADLPFDLAV